MTETIYIPSHHRGKADHGWLQARHTFSFADYYDEARMGFGALRVINDDIIMAGQGFGTHGHQDMEIITVPLSGTLAHADSLGHERTISTGEIQTMSAGTGIRHSEYNHSSTDTVNILQIWIRPSSTGISPAYDQYMYATDGQIPAGLRLLVSPDTDHRPETLAIHQDAYISIGRLAEETIYSRQSDRHGICIMLIDGQASVQLGDHTQSMQSRDTLLISDISQITISPDGEASVLIIETV